MIYSMITGDMLTFGIIYTIVLFGFSQSFYFLYKGFPGVKSTLFYSYHSTWMALFQITMGDYSYSDLSYTTYPNLSKTVFAIFMVLVPILLLNMLIAMMGNTYAHVIEQSEKEWVKQWAKIVVSLERAVSQKDAQNYLQEYSIKLGPGDDPNNPASEQRGVMVIKSKSKTKAKQRKGAVSNWKRVGKVTINELRKRGMTGEELRRIMWGRASFSTPVRASLNIDDVGVMPVVFGDALTAALDVMTYSQDPDMAPATNEATKIMNQNSIASNAPLQTTSNGQIRTITNGQQIESIPTQQTTSNNSIAQVQAQNKSLTSVKPTNLMSTTASKSQQDSVNRFGVIVEADKSSGIEENSDPLLALVITSEVEGSNPKTLLKLAESSRLVSEATLKPVKPSIDPTILEGFSITNVAIAASMKSTLIRKQYFIESSDNDVCGNDYLLGTEARLRRIKSANSRYVTTKRKSGQDDDSSSSSPSVENNSGYHLLLNEPEDISSQQPKPSVKVDSKPTETISKTQNGKSHRRRPKTARNRISPKETSQAETEEKNKEGSDPSSPTDPLEPWSTRGIKDMNTILAWKETTHDSP